MPEIDRSRKAAYAQIAEWYRNKILNGEYKPGSKFPSIPQIAREWNVSPATAQTALNRLQVAGHVYSVSGSGTFVSTENINAFTPGERIKGGVRQARERGEVVHVSETGIVVPPDYVTKVLGVEAGTQVIRREEVTSRQGVPRVLSVTWLYTANRDVAAELLSTSPIDGGPEGVITRATGRPVILAEDALRGRAADTREAWHLKVAPGTPILAGTHVWSDAEGPVLYEEWVMPPDQVVRYHYDVTPAVACP